MNRKQTFERYIYGAPKEWSGAKKLRKARELGYKKRTQAAYQIFRKLDYKREIREAKITYASRIEYHSQKYKTTPDYDYRKVIIRYYGMSKGESDLYWIHLLDKYPDADILNLRISVMKIEGTRKIVINDWRYEYP